MRSQRHASSKYKTINRIKENVKRIKNHSTVIFSSSSFFCIENAQKKSFAYSLDSQKTSQQCIKTEGRVGEERRERSGGNENIISGALFIVGMMGRCYLDKEGRYSWTGGVGGNSFTFEMITHIIVAARVTIQLPGCSIYQGCSQTLLSNS